MMLLYHVMLETIMPHAFRGLGFTARVSGFSVTLNTTVHVDTRYPRN